MWANIYVFTSIEQHRNIWTRDIHSSPHTNMDSSSRTCSKTHSGYIAVISLGMFYHPFSLSPTSLLSPCFWYKCHLFCCQVWNEHILTYFYQNVFPQLQIGIMFMLKLFVPVCTNIDWYKIWAGGLHKCFCTWRGGKFLHSENYPTVNKHEQYTGVSSPHTHTAFWWEHHTVCQWYDKELYNLCTSVVLLGRLNWGHAREK
jgi:hypothetical protein